jgi:single-stranded DNA-binding protein
MSLSDRRLEMNNLNSVLIEGVLDADAEFEVRAGIPTATFVVSSKRVLKDRSERLVPVFTKVPCVVHGKLAQSIQEHGKCIKGRGLRVVGRLASADRDSSSLHLLGEHVELRPESMQPDPVEIGGEVYEVM